MKAERWQKIEKIYNAALELEPGQQEAYLDQACAGDESLRKEIQRLLELQSKAESFIESPAIENLAHKMASDSDPLNESHSMVGKAIGRYRFLKQLGMGGMGEVYQAKDHKLGREVAIKVLPKEFAQDPDRVARFRREAKLLASLSHPNIAALYELEESEEIHFLILELVEGKTLSDKLKMGPISLEESLRLALQIADALEAAHEKGVIHRDLKPANIKITPEGKAKLLDFGLAKAFTEDQENLNLSDSQTLSATSTQKGLILGTAPYMSPEQAQGQTLGKQTDIWAFGCVLYEMLSGKSAFPGKNTTEILAAVIRAEPEWCSLPANLHWRLRELMERCLKKELKDRYHDISDVRVDIQKALADPGGALLQRQTIVEPPMRLRLIVPWAAATIILLIITAVAVWNLRRPEPGAVIRFDYHLPEGQQFSRSGNSTLAVSPDGRQIAYGTIAGLYLRSVGELTAKPIPGTEGETDQPFFSPDGKWIGYLSHNDRKLKKVSVSGGAAVALCDSSFFLGASWGTDDRIVYGEAAKGILQVSANGGNPESLVKSPSIFLSYPQILPDGKSLLYTAGVEQPQIMVRSLKSGKPKRLFEGAGARYLPTGHLLYKLPDNSDLFAIAFDFNRLEAVGRPVSVVGGIREAAISSAGTLAYISGVAGIPEAAQCTLVWVDRSGKEDPITAPPNNYAQPRISHDGTRLAFSAGRAKDLWVWDFIRKSLTRLTFEKANEIGPIWTPDDKWIVYFLSFGNVEGGIYRKPADGTGDAEKLFSLPDRVLLPYSWSIDGNTLAMGELVAESDCDIGILSMEGARTRKPLIQTKNIEAIPMISPDGQWMAYVSNEATGVPLKGDIYVRPFPNVNEGKWPVSTGGGICPLWSPDGSELYYLSDDNSVMSVPVETKPTISFGIPKMLFKNRYLGVEWSSGCPWDIHPDGKRFLMIKPNVSTSASPAAEVPRPRINVVLNWFEELKGKVPRD